MNDTTTITNRLDPSWLQKQTKRRHAVVVDTAERCEEGKTIPVELSCFSTATSGDVDFSRRTNGIRQRHLESVDRLNGDDDDDTGVVRKTLPHSRHRKQH